MMMKAADYFIIVGTELLSLNFLSWEISVTIIRKHVTTISIFLHLHSLDTKTHTDPRYRK